MSPALQRALALWAALLVAAVCLGFVPVSRWVAILLILVVWALLAASLYVASRRSRQEATHPLDNLPEATYRQPVVLVCGDMPYDWPMGASVLTVTQGCWIRVDRHQDVEQVAHQLLLQRPDWGRQLSVMVTVCPQRHHDTEALTSDLLALRWQILQLRRDTGQGIPLVLNGQVGSAMMKDELWQAAVPGNPISVWRDAFAPCSVASWVAAGGATAIEQQVLMNGLVSWFQQHVHTVFTDANPDISPVLPAAVLWGLRPSLNEALPSSVWRSWMQRHTALNQVAGWLPAAPEPSTTRLLPDFVLPLLPEGLGLTPRQRAWRHGLTILTLAAIAALCSSAWNNRQLLQRLAFDIRHYDRISMDDYGPKAQAVNVLRQDATELDDYARNGEPLRMGLGLYQGGRLRLPVLDAIRAYIPPPPPPPPEPDPEPEPAPKIVRLDSLSLFDSGKAVLKADSTKVLINALVGIKAKPGWLIVVAGHTDDTGNPQRNQALSQKRAEAVRDWMRDTGDVPESCFAVQGYGESRPVATNDTPEGRALNRRVEISLVPQADACRLPDATTASLDERDASTQEME